MSLQIARSPRGTPSLRDSMNYAAPVPALRALLNGTVSLRDWNRALLTGLVAKSAIHLACVALFCLLIAGCSKKPGSPAAMRAIDPWVLTCYDFRAPEPAYLTNGLVGARIERDGTGTGPLLIAGQYDAKEDLVQFPNPFQASWTGFNLPDCTDYAQSLDMRSGVLRTSWTQKNFRVISQTVIAPDRTMAATRWDIETFANTRIEVDESCFGILPQPLMNQSSSEVRVFLENLSPKISVLTALRLPHVNGFSCYNLHAMGEAPAHRQITFEQVWAFEPQPNEAIQNVTFEAIRNESSSVWNKRWQTDIAIDGPAEDQQAIHSWLFYLRAGLSGRKETDYSPMGLSSLLYKGHVFWDADMWMFPSLCFVDPDSASGIVEFRLREHQESGNGANGSGIRYPWESAVSGKELAPPALRNEIHATGDVAFMLQQAAALGLADTNQANQVLDGAAQFYLSRATSGGKYLHLNKVTGADEYYSGDDDLYTNALAQWVVDRAAQTAEGSTFKTQDSTFKTIRKTQDTRHKKSEKHNGRLGLRPRDPSASLPDGTGAGGMTARASPPRFFDFAQNDSLGSAPRWNRGGRDDNLGFAEDTRHKTQDIRTAQDSTLNAQLSPRSGATFFLPHDAKSLVEFPADPVRNYEQADAVLTIYPLQNETALRQASTMMNRFPPKTDPAGPAMTDSVSAIVWARLGQADTAYNLWRKSWMEFSRHPLGLFSEVRNKDRTYFQTGAAGCLQTVLYGFLGFRIDWQKDEKAEWETRLDQGYTLTVNPHLPSAWKKVVFRNFSVLGRRLTLTATHSGITVTQGEP